MTNKEELREKWIKKCSIATKGEGKDIYSFGLHEDCADPDYIFDFFWNEIEQVEQDAYKRAVEIIKNHKRYDDAIEDVALEIEKLIKE